MEETSICVIDQEGKLVLETKVETDPDAIFSALEPYAKRLRRVGHEAGSFSPWLQVELQQFGLPVVCLEAYHARAALSAMRNKTGRTDAQGIAHIVRTGWFKQVHVKREESYRLRLLLTHRRNLKRKFLDIENAVRHSIKTFGLKLGSVSRGQFEARMRELKAQDSLIAGIADCVLRARGAVAGVSAAAQARRRCREQGRGLPTLHGHTRGRADQRAGVQASVDDPRRFRRSKTVGAYLGLTAKRWHRGPRSTFPGTSRRPATARSGIRFTRRRPTSC
jgi:transposase